MTQESNFDRYWRLGIKSLTHADELESYKMVLDSGLFLSKQMEELVPKLNRPAHISDALTLFQMTLTKGISLCHLTQGIAYHNPIGEFRFDRLIDPMSMSTILRAQFEAFTNFHNIYIYSGDIDTLMLLYDLWVVSGLKYRQSFADSRFPEIVITDEMKGNPHINEEYEAIEAAHAKRLVELEKKIEEEATQVEEIVERIHVNPVYLALSADQQKTINTCIKKREFQLLLDDSSVKTVGWRDLFLNAGVKEMFYHLYSNMSLGSHPSNVSVFQYEQMFADHSNETLAFSNLRISKILLAFLITDFCIYFPDAMTKFQHLPIVAQLIIDGFNINFRSEEYALSENRIKFFDDHDQQFANKLQANHNKK